MKALKNTTLAAVGLFALAALVAMPAAADQVIPDDLIVQFSACIGNDCNNGESFGFDTLRLKENNLRIHFDDTSSTASFPQNDWRIRINDTSNGGGSYFGVEDATAGRTPFRIEAGARENALYVDSAGRVGIGTNNPVVELHVVDGDSPTLRLEQNGSSGFAPQTFDVAGNETNFFVRDVTNGSKLGFRMRPGAPTSSIDVAASGNVGIGTDSPTAPLHVRRSNETAQVLVEEVSATDAVRNLLELTNNGAVRVKFSDTSSNFTWAHSLDPTGNFSIRCTSGATCGLGSASYLTLNQSNGDVTAATFNGVSSRDKKNVVRPVDPASVLAKVAAMPLAEWTFKKGSGDIHLGPMAEDFHAAFGLGSSPKQISLMDASGIALAAIQGLRLEVEAKDQRISDLEARLAALEAALEVTP